MLAEAQLALAPECKTGSGKRCAGIQRTIDVYEAAGRGEQAKLDQIGPAKLVARTRRSWRTYFDDFHSFEGTRQGRSRSVKPLLIALCLEFGAIASFGFAFRGEAEVLETRSVSDRKTFSDPDINWADLPSPAMFSADLPEPTPPRGPRKRKTLPANVLRFPAKHPMVHALESVGGSIASNRELARLMHVSDGKASKRWQEVQDQLSIHRQRKQLKIALR